MSETKKLARIKSDFSDNGTGESYTKGQKLSLDKGVFDNYVAAGLAEAATARATPRTKPKGKAAPAAKAASKTSAASPPAGEDLGTSD